MNIFSSLKTIAVLVIVLILLVIGIFVVDKRFSFPGGRSDSSSEIVIREPQAGSVLLGNTSVTAVFPPDYSYSDIELLVDGQLEVKLGTPSQNVKRDAPYEVSFLLDTSKYPDGEHTLIFKIYKNLGQQDIREVKVTFDQKAAPKVTIDNK